ncbi:DMT family transporter [Calothrix sp. UHCC 0171]|uniref:DMT family transporter n=1 Tax=Calothrix sp. UHCC 0171 TaxID=3110245 RepID=UPI002B212B3C|nr:DMT family transporter [Calothrix sp. UHCC 0171]MEA5569938.1 DMT family transporter [Calothrix sp. UHCC 0171]
MTNFEGEIAALVAAILWSISSVVYGRVGAHIPPLHLNLIKGIVAIAFLVVTIVITGDFFPLLPPIPLCLLLLSGLIGVGLGDTAFLAAINSMGARRVLLLETLAPPITAVLAWIFLREGINISAWCGILLTILGVAWVISERTLEIDGDGGERKRQKQKNSIFFLFPPLPPQWQGITFGLIAAIANAAGAVLSRAALADTNININPLWAALLRLGAAVFVLIPGILRQQQSRTSPIFPYWQSKKVILATCFAAFCGTYLGIWLQQVAIKFTAVGVASTLLQTSPVFVLPLSMLMGDKVSLRAIAGVLVAIAGIALLFYLK